jgi:hypothetical protein
MKFTDEEEAIINKMIIFIWVDWKLRSTTKKWGDSLPTYLEDNETKETLVREAFRRCGLEE